MNKCDNYVCPYHDCTAPFCRFENVIKNGGEHFGDKFCNKIKKQNIMKHKLIIGGFGKSREAKEITKDIRTTILKCDNQTKIPLRFDKILPEILPEAVIIDDLYKKTFLKNIDYFSSLLLNGIQVNQRGKDPFIFHPIIIINGRIPFTQIPESFKRKVDIIRISRLYPKKLDKFNHEL